MENYTITKDQILENYKYALNNQDYLSARNLKEWFPDAFKKELEVGKWYKRPHNSALFYVTEILNIDSNHCKVFGFDNWGDWMPENAKTFPDNDFEATPKQVETALINQAKKRGYKKGVKIKGVTTGNTITLPRGEFEFLDIVNALWFGKGYEGYDVFKDGKWAEIIPEETKVITMDKAFKILSKKYGKQVEIK